MVKGLGKDVTGNELLRADDAFRVGWRGGVGFLS